MVVWEASRSSRYMAVSLQAGPTSAKLYDKRLGYGRRFYDLGRAGDRARVLHDFVDAEQDAGETSEWVKVRHAQRIAAQGKLHGRRLPYGYRHVYSGDAALPELIGQEPEPEEAQVVAEVFRRFAAGDSGRGIAA